MSIEEESRLCASIFETDFYKQASVTYKGYVRRPEDKYVIESLEFKVPQSVSEQLSTENIICEGEHDGRTDVFFLARSYNDEDSVFVQKKNHNSVFMDAYIRDIPVLMNTFGRIQERETDSKFELDLQKHISDSNSEHYRAKQYLQKIPTAAE